MFSVTHFVNAVGLCRNYIFLSNYSTIHFVSYHVFGTRRQHIYQKITEYHIESFFVLFLQLTFVLDFVSYCSTKCVISHSHYMFMI